MPALALVATVAAISLFLVQRSKPQQVWHHLFPREFQRNDIAGILGRRRITAENLRENLTLTIEDSKFELVSTVQLELQEKIEAIYRQYDPMYAAFVAMDPATGAILVMADHSRIGHSENLALRGSYPAASVFKLITSAAAIESAKMNPDTAIPFTGAYSTLYKRNLGWQESRWTRRIPLSEAFAKSINSIFGKIAIKGVGRDNLQQYANAFGFNQAINFEMPMDISNVIIPTDDEYGLAEAGSGYTKRQTLSPVQGALIAATIANGGKTPQPSIIKTIYDEERRPVYELVPNTIAHPITSRTAEQLSAMMEHTITEGTARKTYRDYDRHPILSKLFVGAKTGSLTGMDPQGKYDWFVGFARSTENPQRQIAFASLIVNDRYWRVKSSYVARELLLEYFKDLRETGPKYLSSRDARR